MSGSFQVRIRRQGNITLPKELREKNGIKNGDTLTLTDLGDRVVIISSRRSRVDEISTKLTKEWQDSGETLDSILATLREVRTDQYLKKT